MGNYTNRILNRNVVEEEPMETARDKEHIESNELAHMNTSLVCAAKAGNVEWLKKLITAGADVNEQNQDGLTALFAAAFKGH